MLENKRDDIKIKGKGRCLNKMDDIKVKGDGGIEKIKWVTTHI